MVVGPPASLAARSSVVAARLVTAFGLSAFGFCCVARVVAPARCTHVVCTLGVAVALCVAARPTAALCLLNKRAAHMDAGTRSSPELADAEALLSSGAAPKTSNLFPGVAAASQATDTRDAAADAKDSLPTSGSRAASADTSSSALAPRR